VHRYRIVVDGTGSSTWAVNSELAYGGSAALAVFFRTPGTFRFAIYRAVDSAVDTVVDKPVDREVPIVSSVLLRLVLVRRTMGAPAPSPEMFCCRFT
jgi:hypothetical protein